MSTEFRRDTSKAAEQLEALAQRVRKLLVEGGFPERGERGDQGPQGFRGLDGDPGPSGPPGPPDPDVARQVEEVWDRLQEVGADIVKARESPDLHALVQKLDERLTDIERRAHPIIETVGAIRPGGGFPFAKPGRDKIAVGDPTTGEWTLIDIDDLPSAGGAPTGAKYLVTEAHAGLSAEVVVGTTPGGELGGTWDTPTVDTVHSGSSHAAVQAAAEATAATALAAHTGDTDDAHDASAVSSVPAGTLAASNVQSALNELDAEKVPIVRSLTAGDGLSGGGDLSADRTFAVNVDGSTLEINADTLRVKAGGVGSAHWTQQMLDTLNDHDWRHEDGGPDEIDLTGLSGVGADVVPKTRLLTAGTALLGGGTLEADRVFHVNPDYVTIDVDVPNDAIRVKAGGVGSAHWTSTMMAEFNRHAHRHVIGGDDVLEGSIPAFARVGVRRNSTGTYLGRRRLNLIEGTNITVSIADDADNEEVDVTIASSGGGGSGTDFSRSIAQTGHGLAVGDVVRYSGTAYVKARADTAANSEAVGIVSAVADANNFTLHFGGRITTLSGLAAGTVYFLSAATAGLLTSTEPSTVGQVSKPLLIADSTTSGYLFNFRGIAIGAGAERRFQATVFPVARSIVVGDDAYRFFVSDDMGGMNLVDADASKLVSGGGGTLTLQVRNVTQGADMLSTRITVDPHEFNSYTAIAPPVIDAANDDVATGDIIAIDVDDSGIGGSAIGPKGLGVTLAFRTP